MNKTRRRNQRIRLRLQARIVKELNGQIIRYDADGMDAVRSSILGVFAARKCVPLRLIVDDVHAHCTEADREFYEKWFRSILPNRPEWAQRHKVWLLSLPEGQSRNQFDQREDENGNPDRALADRIGDRQADGENGE